MTITEEDKVKMNSPSVSLDSVTRDNSAVGTKRIQMERKIQQQASVRVMILPATLVTYTLFCNITMR